MAALSTLAAIATIGSAVGGIVMGQKQMSAQKDAQAQARADAQKAADAADQANNKANAKKPDLGAIALANKDLGMRGVGSTLLTGPSGADMTNLKLGKSTLLGS